MRLRAYFGVAGCFSHIKRLLQEGYALLRPVIDEIGSYAASAVLMFIIISGFVITHLLIEKREKYAPFITRRFLRLYPAYFFCLIAGIVSSYLYARTFGGHP